MATFDEILTIANQLANQGKKPTVALVKSRLTSSFPLPTIIKVLKSWQHEPEFINFKEEKSGKQELAAKNLEMHQIELIVEKNLTPIKLELADIKSQLAQLIAFNNINKK